MKENEFITLNTFNPLTNLSMTITVNVKFAPKDEQSAKELIQILEMSCRQLKEASTNFIFN